MKLCECGCGNPAPMAKQSHPERGQVKGEPLRFIRGHYIVRPLYERFWEKVNKHGGIPSVCPELGECWLWTGAHTALGYGVTWNGTRTIHATHAAIYLETGVWPTLHACHKCDNPPCVRYSHLFEGTRSDNTQDALRKGRLNPWSKGLSKLSKEQKDSIRAEYSEGNISQRALGRKYGVQHAFIGKIVRGEA